MRARNIKPGFFKNEELAELEPLVRLLFTGLWCMADREGRLEDRPKRIKAEVLPYDKIDIAKALDSLSRKKFILRYKAEDKEYIQILNFTKHQDPHYKESPSQIPAPDGHIDSLRKHPALTNIQKEEIYFRDGKKCKKCKSTKNLTIDHIIPLSLGGDNNPNNLQVLCNSCNASKNNRLISGQHRPKVDPSLGDVDPLIPDSLIPDSLIPDKEALSAKPTPSPKISVHDLSEIWNKHAPAYLGRVKTISDKRAKKLRRSMNGYDDPLWWENLFKDIDNSDFYSGKDGKWTGMDFDWAVINCEKLRGKLDRKDIDPWKSINF